MKIFLVSVIATAFVLTACSTVNSIDARQSLANDLGLGAGMMRHEITAAPFLLTSWQKITAPGNVAHVYIEGDGLAWVNRYKKSNNPTPSNPVALRLAALDPAPNVIYLARPCQYSGMAQSSACPDIYWTRARTAPEVIEAYQHVLNTLRDDHAIPAFELIGYSGGGAVAVLLAAGRPDVAAIRTVAGNIDYATFTALHKTTPIEDSIDPFSVVSKISSISQVHFTGTADDVVPRALADHWQATAASPCVTVRPVMDASHDKGWEAAWPALLAEPLPCR